MNSSNRYTDQSQSWQTDRRGHVPDLTLLALTQLDLDPRGGAMRSDRLGTRWQAWRRNEAGFAGQGPISFEINPTFQLTDFIQSWFTFYHHPICFFVFMDTRQLC